MARRRQSSAATFGFRTRAVSSLPFEFQTGGDSAKAADNDKSGTLFDQQRRRYETVVLNGSQQITDIGPGGDAKGILLQVYPGQRYRLKMS